MSVGSADAESAHCGAQRSILPAPCGSLGIHEKGSAMEFYLGVGMLKMKAWNPGAVLKGQHGLDESSHACGYVGMPYVRFDRTDRAGGGLAIFAAIDLR